MVPLARSDGSAAISFIDSTGEHGMSNLRRISTADKTKFEAVDILRKFDIPCSPVLSMKEIAADPSLRASGTARASNRGPRGPRRCARPEAAKP
jgi:crotonobetainyl-CoA:carnitine CoA-transferase CaiB-like acyl-CoA transferase